MGRVHISRRIKGILVPVLLSFCFILGSLLFLTHMVSRGKEESLEYLHNAANQNRTSILKQIEGDFQTLEGLAIVLSGLNLEEEKLLEVLGEINDANAFIRMGYAGLDGEVSLVDLNGEVYRYDIGHMGFFQQAAGGEKSVSDIFLDQYQDELYVNYYGVPLRDEQGNIHGVLCAVHSAAVLRQIIDAPLLNGEGYSDIVNSKGSYVLQSIRGAGELFEEKNRSRIAEYAAMGASSDFELTDYSGGQQLVSMVPILENRWYLVSVVAAKTLRQRYIGTVAGVMLIISAACIIFIFFLMRQMRMSEQNEKSLKKLAYRDSLTCLRSYDGLKLDMPHMLEDRELSGYYLWYGDLHNFKLLNDMLGYEDGDRLLTLIGDFLGRLENDSCMSCRVSADNFCGVIKCDGMADFEKGIQMLMEFLQHSGTDGIPVIEIAMGIYRLRSEDRSSSVDILINYAHMAHEVAKRQGGTRIELYSDEIRSRQIEDTRMESEMEDALKRGEFQVYMQPKVNIQMGNRLVGAEALVRWISPEKGMISPVRFIPLLEKSDRIILLDRYMFRQVCCWARDYLAAGGRPINLAVNVSKVGLVRADFMDYYSGVKAEYGIPDGMIELEFTESVVSGDMELFVHLVKELQERGFICSLDDFGSGYSSLNLLKNLPIDVLKLDMMFFRQSISIRRERIVVANFISLAKELKIKTIAEGVERMDSVDFLREAGCDVIQGYIFAKPMPLKEFEKLVWEQGEKPLTAIEEIR